MNVFWTATAKETYLYIIDYLEEVWRERCVKIYQGYRKNTSSNSQSSRYL
jgi:hypothetical protein